MEEVNETALVSMDNIVEELQIPNFNYGNMRQERIDELKTRVATTNSLTGNLIDYIGETLAVAKQYFKEEFGRLDEFTTWAETVYGRKRAMINIYIQAYQSRLEIKNAAAAAIDDRVDNVSVYKFAALSKLPTEQQVEIVENAPLNEMSREEVYELTKKVKEAGEYNEQLLEVVRQGREELKNTTEEKDKTIQELQDKIKELEKVQPVAQTEPEIIEKVVEVEKVVEKEVIPDEIRQELEELRNTNKILEEDNKDKASFIKEQNSRIKEQQDKINSLQIDDTIPEDELPEMKIASLLSFIDEFLRHTSGYTLLKGKYGEISKKTEQVLLSNIDRVEDWCLLMKQAINDEKNMVGNTVIIGGEEI